MTTNATELAKTLRAFALCYSSTDFGLSASMLAQQAYQLIEQQAEELAAFRLQCEHGISIEYDGSYVTAWKGDIEETLECAEGDRMTAIRMAIEAVARGIGKEQPE